MRTAAAAFDRLVEDLARGARVPLDRVLLVLAASNRTQGELQVAADLFAAKLPRRIAASSK